MGRLSPLDLSALDPVERSRIEEGESLMGFLPNDALTMARVPGMTGAALELVRAVYSPGRVDMQTKRLVALMNSAASGCVYCQSHARFGSLRSGISQAKLDAVWEYETSPEFDERERTALRIAHLSALQPNAVEDSHFDALKQHYTEDEAAEIVAVIALFGFLNRWNDTVRTEIEELPATAAGAQGA